MENKRIVKKSALYFIGNFSSKILTALLVPIYAFYISTEDLGIYDYSQTIMNIVIPVIFVSIWEAIIRFILGEKENVDKGKKFATSAFFTLAICVVFTIITLLISRFIDIQYTNYFILMTCFSALAQIWQYYSRAVERNKLYVASSIISTFVNLILNILLIMVFKVQIEALYISYICSQLVLFVILEFKLKIFKMMKFKNLDFTILKRMIVYSMPLVINSIASWLISGFGRIIIFENLGASGNGLYTFANKFVTIITTIGSVVTMAILEEAMISLRSDKLNNNLPKVLQQIFHLFLGLIIFAMPAIDIFYLFIDTTEYYQSLYLLPGLLLYSVFLTMSMNLGIIFKTVDKNKYQVITTVLGSAIMIGGSYLLLDRLGVYAVVIGQLVSSLVMFLSRYFISKRFITYSIKWLPVVFLVIVYLLVSVISINGNLVIKIIVLILTIGFVIIINKNFLKDILKIKKKEKSNE